MNFFESELRKIVKNCDNIHSPKYIGKACTFRMDGGLTGKIEISTGIMADHYDRFKIKVMNRSEGVVDSQVVTFEDILGKKQTNYGEKISPHICGYSKGDYEWYGMSLNAASYAAISETVNGYLDSFIEQDEAESEDFEM